MIVADEVDIPVDVIDDCVGAVLSMVMVILCQFRRPDEASIASEM